MEVNEWREYKEKDNTQEYSTHHHSILNIKGKSKNKL
jgi:hypothetical protein